MREYMSTEYYTLVRPEGAGKEEDLLGGCKQNRRMANLADNLTNA
jgi:hypothetical protein